MAEAERIDIRLSAEHKKLIERAAAATGHASVSSFAKVHLLELARRSLEQCETRELSERDWHRFHEIIDQTEPNEDLKKAAQAYRKKHDEG